MWSSSMPSLPPPYVLSQAAAQAPGALKDVDDEEYEERRLAVAQAPDALEEEGDEEEEEDVMNTLMLSQADLEHVMPIPDICRVS